MGQTRARATSSSQRTDDPFTPSSAAAGQPGAVLRPRRSPRLVIVGVLASCLGALGAVVAFTQTTRAEPVVVMVADVSRGEVVESSDLGVATLGTPPGVNSYPASDLQQLVGKQALVDLPAGSLVGSRSIGDLTTREGTSELGLKLAAGRLPTSALPAGTTVLLVPVVTADRASPGSQQPSPQEGIEATVVSQPTLLPDGGTWVLDVAIADDKAVSVAQLAATDSLVVVKRGGSLMAVIVVASATGAPGVTTSALLLALQWPRDVLLADADRTPSQAIESGYLRDHGGESRGLLALAHQHRARANLTAVCGRTRCRSPRTSPPPGASCPASRIPARPTCSRPSGTTSEPPWPTSKGWVST